MFELIGIFAALITIFLFGYKPYATFSNKNKLENYLKSEKKHDRGRRTINHLIRNLQLTEQEILNAVKYSKHIKMLNTVDRDTNKADGILLEYKP